MSYVEYGPSKDELAVLDHVTGLTRTLPEPVGAPCPDRAIVGELVAMRSLMGGMAIQPPPMRLTFEDILDAAELETSPPAQNRVIYWLTGRWGIGFVTAASVALALITGMAATGELVGRDGLVFDNVTQISQFSESGEAPAMSEEIPGPPGPSISLHGSITRRGSLNLRHADPALVQRQITDLVTSSGGVVTNLTRQGSGESTEVTVSLAIPADKYRDFKGKVAAFGEVLHETESTEDVTSEQVDFKSRLEEAEDYLTRLDKLIDKPSDLHALQNLERERRNTRLEIERYRRALQSLESRVAMSSLDVRVMATEVQEETEPGPWGEAWSDGLSGLEAVGGTMLRAGIAGSPFLAIGALAYLLLRRKRRQLDRAA